MARRSESKTEESIKSLKDEIIPQIKKAQAKTAAQIKRQTKAAAERAHNRARKRFQATEKMMHHLSKKTIAKTQKSIKDFAAEIVPQVKAQTEEIHNLKR